VFHSGTLHDVGDAARPRVRCRDRRNTDLTVRHKIRDEAFLNAEKTTLRWSAHVRGGQLPHPIPTSAGIDLIQVVDAQGRIVTSTPQTGRAPLSMFRPEPGDRLRRWTECLPDERCVLLVADRISPSADSPVVYAGAVEPSILSTHDLEYAIAAAALVMTVVLGWLTWRMTGRSLRPVEQQYQLASTTSHELRNPIAGLRVQLEEALLYPDHVNARDTIQGPCRPPTGSRRSSRICCCWPGCAGASRRRPSRSISERW
jgi:signal transduction histidine kinase